MAQRSTATPAVPLAPQRFRATSIQILQIVGAIVGRAGSSIGIEPRLVVLVDKFLMLIDDDEFLERFVTKSYQHWEKIRNSEMSFFVDNAGSVFSETNDPETVGLFCKLIAPDATGKSHITPVEQQTLWARFQTLVKISLRYLEGAEVPGVQGLEPWRRLRSQHPELKNVDLGALLKLWKLDPKR